MANKTNEKSVVTADDLHEHLRNYELTPFLDVLEDWMRHQPSSYAITRLAEGQPQVWVNAVVNLARLAGYTERKEIHHSGRVDFHALSDTELEQMIVEKTAALGISKQSIEEATVVIDTAVDASPTASLAALGGEDPVPKD